MLDKLKSLWARVRVRWYVLLAALAAAAPDILNYMGLIDLRPILSQFLPDNYVSMIVGILPFALVFLKSAVSVEPASEED